MNNLEKLKREVIKILGVNSLILECREAVEKAINIALRTASMHEARTYRILAPSSMQGEIWAYRCSWDGANLIEACVGDKHVYIRYDDTWIKAFVQDVSQSLFCIKRENSNNERKTRKRKR